MSAKKSVAKKAGKKAVTQRSPKIEKSSEQGVKASIGRRSARKTSEKATPKAKKTSEPPDDDRIIGLNAKEPGLVNKISGMLNVVPVEMREKIVNLLVKEGPRAAEACLVALLPRVKDQRVKIPLNIILEVLRFISKRGPKHLGIFLHRIA